MVNRLAISFYGQLKSIHDLHLTAILCTKEGTKDYKEIGLI